MGLGISHWLRWRACRVRSTLHLGRRMNRAASRDPWARGNTLRCRAYVGPRRIVLDRLFILRQWFGGEDLQPRHIRSSTSQKKNHSPEDSHVADYRPQKTEREHRPAARPRPRPGSIATALRSLARALPIGSVHWSRHGLCVS
jgi:hypothetical protein